MRQPSIRTKMLHILAGILLIVVLMSIGIVLMSQRIFLSIQENLSTQGLLSGYYEQIRSIQFELLSQLTDPDEATRDACEQRLEVLVETAERMAANLADPLFTDHMYLSRSYAEAAKNFLRRLSEGDAAKAMDAFLGVEHIHDLIQSQFTPLANARESLAQQNLRMLSSLWHRQVVVMFLCVGAIIAVLCFMGMRFIEKTLSPISQLTRQAEQIAKGDAQLAQFPPVSSRYYETQVLAAAFVLMSSTIHEQMQQLKDRLEVTEALHALEIENMRMQVALTKTELQFIQSLINPHFLFNSLNVLTSLAYLEDAPRVQQAAALIAQFFRQSMHRLGKNVSVKMEAEHIGQYIAIQRMRFGERVSFDVRYDAPIAEAQIPAMILQPLVENAVIHGVGSYLSGGFVRVRIESIDEGALLRIIVEDNGKGQSPERTAQILEDLRLPFVDRQTGIGLRSVYARMHEAYGDAFAFQMESAQGGTKVTLVAPTSIPAAEQGISHEVG